MADNLLEFSSFIDFFRSPVVFFPVILIGNDQELDKKGNGIHGERVKQHVNNQTLID
jgi:hypothetical protein